MEFVKRDDGLSDDEGEDLTEVPDAVALEQAPAQYEDADEDADEDGKEEPDADKGWCFPCLCL